MKYFSLFSGIGGFEAGFQIATSNHAMSTSWQCVGYSEVNPYALAIYRRHYPDHKEYGDATQLDTRSLPDFDLLTGGFPCQSFSIAGQRKGFADARGTLFFEIARVLSDKRPRYFLLENVKGLLSVEGGEVFTQILGILSNIGYDCQWEVLNSKYFGVPQSRQRIFLAGHLRTEPRPNLFPLCPPSPADHQVQSEEANTQRNVSRCLLSRYGQRWADDTYILSRTRGHFPGGVNTHAPSLSTSSYEHNHLVALREAQHTNGVALREVQHTNMHERRIRRMTPVEAERLQAFPDNYTAWGVNEKGEQIPISNTQRYKCLGNAVTVSVVAAIAERLITCVQENM